MAGFFGSDAPYNTVTSPEQEAAAGAGAQDTQPPPTKFSAFKAQDMPMGRIMAAVMRSAAAVQGQTQAKKVATEQQASNSKLSVTMTANPDGGPPLVNVKNAPADLLNGTQDQDVKDAYNTPKQQVEAKLSGAAPTSAQTPLAAPAAPQPAAPTAPQPPEHPLEQAASALEANGVSVLRPWDPKIHDSVKSEANLVAIGQQLGLPDPKRNAHDAWKKIQRGEISPDVVVQRLANFASQKLQKQSQDLQQTLEPYQQAKQRAQIEKDRQEANARLMRSLTDAEREKVYKEKTDIVKSTDWSTIPAADVAKTLEDMNRSGVPFDQREVNFALRKRSQDIAADFKHFTEPRGPNVFSLGDYDSWEQAKATLPYGAELTKEQNDRGRAAWDSANKYAQRKAAEEARKVAKDNAYLEALRIRIENASKDKPERIGPADVNLMSADEITRLDPNKVKDYDGILRHKEGELKKAIKKANDEIAVKQADLRGVNDTPSFQRRFGWQRDVADATAKVALAKRDAADLNAELQAITSKRRERAGVQPVAPTATTPNIPPPVRVGPAPATKAAPPKVGDKKTFTAGPYAGKTGTWNGSAYVVPRG